MIETLNRLACGFLGLKAAYNVYPQDTAIFTFEDGAVDQIDLAEDYFTLTANYGIVEKVTEEDGEIINVDVQVDYKHIIFKQDLASISVYFSGDHECYVASFLTSGVLYKTFFKDKKEATWLAEAVLRWKTNERAYKSIS